MRKRQESFLPEPKLFPFWFKAFIGTVFAAQAMASYIDYDSYARAAAEQLKNMTAQRNSCELPMLEPILRDAGNLAFRLTVQVHAGTHPEEKNNDFDTVNILDLVLIDTNFWDESGDPNSLVVAGPKDAPAPEVRASSQNDPDGPTDIAIISFDTIPVAGTIYTVSKRNTITARTELGGGLMSREASASSLVLCGEVRPIASSLTS